MGKKRRSWHLVDRNYDAVIRESERRGLSINAMLNEIVREWREENLPHFDTKMQPKTSNAR